MRESNQALFNTEGVLAVDDEMIADLKDRALAAEQRRFRLCLHHSPEEAVQEMLIVHCRGNYTRPHYHHAPSSLMMLEGELTMFLFDSGGKVTRIVEMGPRGSGKPFTLRLGPGIWHMPVCRTPQIVFYETMTGPFRRDEVNVWAPWSPEEDDAQGISEYLSTFGID